MLSLICCTTSKANDNVINEFLFEFIDGVSINVETSTDVYQITLPANGKSYSKSEIESISSTNPEMMGAIKISVKGLIYIKQHNLESGQLKESFPNAAVLSLQELPTYSNGIFLDTYKIKLTSEFFSLNESVKISDFINGMMDSGAIINYTFPLQAYGGWNNTYIFHLPLNMTYKITNGDVKQNKIKWEVLTYGEANEKNAEVSLKSVNPTSSYSENTSMNISFIIDCKNPLKPILTMQYDADTIQIDEYKILPSFVSNVKALPADAIRLCVLNNFTSWEQIKNRTFKPIHLQVKDLIESSSFNQTLTTKFSWTNATTDQIDEPYDLSHMDEYPSIICKYSDEDIDFSILNISSRSIFGLVNAGAKVNIQKEDVNFGDNLDRLYYPFSGTIKLPQYVLLNGINEFKWNKNSNISGSFGSEKNPTYSSQKINTTILLDVESTDMNLLSFFTGNTELRLGLYLKETQKRHVSSLTEEFNLPSEVNISLINSDAFRLCIEEGVFTNTQIDAFLSKIAEVFENRTKSIFHSLNGETRSERSVFDASLSWDKNISAMDDSSPVIVSSSMHSSYPLSYSFSFIPPSFSVNPQNLSFESIPNQDVTYKMVFPKGTSIDIFDTLDRAVVRKTEDGRVYFEVSFNASEGNLVTNVNCIIHPTGLFIVGLLVPCIVSILITIILFIVVFMIRKKRRNLRIQDREKLSSEYEEQDYYVPPPPPSRRKRKK